VDEPRVCVVSEVKAGQVEKVDDENQLGPVKVRSDKQHDKRKVEEVVHDEVASHTGRGVDNVLVGREEMGDVTTLQDEEDDPEDGGDDGVHGEGGWVEIVLVPDAPADVVPIVRLIDAVVNRHNEGEEPGEGGEDLVSGDGAGRVRLSFGERVPGAES
jgi:hypothetical protein